MEQDVSSKVFQELIYCKKQTNKKVVSMSVLNLHHPTPPFLTLSHPILCLGAWPFWYAPMGLLFFWLDFTNAGKRGKGVGGDCQGDVRVGNSETELFLCPCCVVSSLLWSSTQGHGVHLLASSTGVLSEFLKPIPVLPLRHRVAMCF